MKKYSVTFYDLIGYLVPGLFLTLVMALMLSFFYDDGVILNKVYALKWPWHLAISYVGGHMVQAVMRVVLPLDITKWWQDNEWDSDLKKTLMLRLANVIPGKDTSPIVLGSLLFNLAEGLVHEDNQIDRAETYRALQGFFRAMTGVSALMTAVCGMFFVKNIPLKIVILGAEGSLSPLLMGLIALLAGASALLFYYRFRQFAAYRFRTVLLAFYISSSGSNEGNGQCGRSSIVSESSVVNHED